MFLLLESLDLLSKLVSLFIKSVLTCDIGQSVFIRLGASVVAYETEVLPQIDP